MSLAWANRCGTILLTMILCLTSVSTVAQDIHFSQYYHNELSTNPAEAGRFDGDYRIDASHRNQWRSVSAPFSTFQVSADARDLIDKGPTGIGIRVMSDQAGDSRFRTLSASALLGQSIALSSDSSITLQVGAELGFSQLSIDYSELRFDAQYNGFAYQGSSPTGELNLGDRIGRFDLHGGLILTKQIDRDRAWTVGASVYNITKPEVNFADNAAVILSRRLSTQLEYIQDLGARWHIIPGARAMWQGPHQEVLIGARMRYTWQDDSRLKRRASIGAFARPGDGAYLMLSADHDAWRFGVSYDFNLSTLVVASRNRGAIELSATYIMDFFDDVREPYRKCIDLL